MSKRWDDVSDDDWSIESTKSKQINAEGGGVRSPDVKAFIKPGGQGPDADKPVSTFISRFRKMGAASETSSVFNDVCSVSEASKTVTEQVCPLDNLARFTNRGFFGTGKRISEPSDLVDTNGSLAPKDKETLANLQSDGIIVGQSHSSLDDEDVEVPPRTYADLRQFFGPKFTFRPRSPPPKAEPVPNPRIKQNSHIPLEYPKPKKASTSDKPKVTNEYVRKQRRGTSGQDFLEKQQRCSIIGFPRRPLGFHVLPPAEKDSNGEEVDDYGRFLIYYPKILASRNGKEEPSGIMGCTYHDGDTILQSSNFAEQLIVVSHELQINTENQRHIWRAIGTETFKGVVELSPELFKPDFFIDIGTCFSAILEYVKPSSSVTDQCPNHLRIRKTSDTVSHIAWKGEIPNSDARECYTGRREWLQVKTRLVREKEYSPYLKSNRYGYVRIPEKVHGVVCDAGDNMDFYDGWIQPLWEPIYFESIDCSVCWEAVSLDFVTSITPEEMEF